MTAAAGVVAGTDTEGMAMMMVRAIVVAAVAGADRAVTVAMRGGEHNTTGAGGVVVAVGVETGTGTRVMVGGAVAATMAHGGRGLRIAGATAAAATGPHLTTAGRCRHRHGRHQLLLHPHLLSQDGLGLAAAAGQVLMLGALQRRQVHDRHLQGVEPAVMPAAPCRGGASATPTTSRGALRKVAARSVAAVIDPVGLETIHPLGRDLAEQALVAIAVLATLDFWPPSLERDDCDDAC